jgi:glycosyltransferase involved in cell wall biosynthesis
LKIVVITDIPSPYQVELFNAIADINGWNLAVVYVRRSAPERNWAPASILHRHCYLFETEISEITSLIVNADLAVFGGYRPIQINRLITIRNRTGKAWAFWGERPGYRFPGRIGRIYRAWGLRKVRSSQAPIWGIGEWALDGYRSELGEQRRFFNVPYCSNLDPFFAIERRFERDKPCRFLFSGNFIPRKGVDLVVSAFGQLSHEGYEAELHLVGSGPLENALKVRSSSFSSKVNLRGFTQWRDLASAYADADILVAPSLYDGWGLVVVEGLAAGMPVISTYSTGAARELIKPGNGWIIPAGNEEALLSVMRSAAILENDRKKAMSYYARQVARSQDLGPGVKRFVQTAEMTLEAWEKSGVTGKSC